MTVNSALPGPVVEVLSIFGIDVARFEAVLEAFGTLPDDGQIDLANQLIHARRQYVIDRREECDPERRQGKLHKHLEKTSKDAGRLLR
jgi:hypothetical protein